MAFLHRTSAPWARQGRSWQQFYNSASKGMQPNERRRKCQRAIRVLSLSISTIHRWRLLYVRPRGEEGYSGINLQTARRIFSLLNWNTVCIQHSYTPSEIKFP